MKEKQISKFCKRLYCWGSLGQRFSVYPTNTAILMRKLHHLLHPFPDIQCQPYLKANATWGKLLLLTGICLLWSQSYRRIHSIHSFSKLFWVLTTRKRIPRYIHTTDNKSMENTVNELLLDQVIYTASFHPEFKLRSSQPCPQPSAVPFA